MCEYTRPIAPFAPGARLLTVACALASRLANEAISLPHRAPVATVRTRQSIPKASSLRHHWARPAPESAGPPASACPASLVGSSGLADWPAFSLESAARCLTAVCRGLSLRLR